MMVFSDGGRFCNRAHWHKNGQPFYLPPGSEDPIMEMEINGTIKYTPDQFKDLCKEGKLDNPNMRELALSGMRGQDRWEVATEEERAYMLKEKELDHEYFKQHKIKNLVTRHIKGQIAKLYDVRVGHDQDGKVNKHLYPIHDADTGDWKGAKCRTLPKDFRFGHLGWTWGKNLMFGQKLSSDVLRRGGRLDTLLLVGGECDTMAAQQMLWKSRTGTKWADIPFHVWSPTKGECALQEIIDNKAEIVKFKKVLLCFDADDTGKKLTQSVAKLFRGKVHKLQLPGTCKDPNDCLKQGKEKEFIDAWFNPVDPFDGGVISSASKFRNKAKEQPVMGLSWPWPELDPVTYGMRLNFLSVWGAGTGVGKTKTTKTIVDHLINVHNKPVVVIYLEEQAEKTVRSFAGELINKDLTAPPINDPDDPDYMQMRDYTTEEADAAIDAVCDNGMLMIGDLQGRKDVDSVLEVCEEAMALGFEYFIIDNLTAFEHKSSEGKLGSVSAIDETMKRLGTFKDENPVNIILLSHLKRPFGERKPHEEGGSVQISDFRGSGSITFWANAVFGIERNTCAENMEERCLTCYHCIKNRDVGYKVGTRVYAAFNFKTGKLLSTNKRPSEEKFFDDGTKPKQTEPETEEKDF
jgi:twinkle protein